MSGTKPLEPIAGWWRVPPTKDILAGAGDSGFTYVSTFSGCGGTGLGMRWAGFKALWASEFIPEAQRAYKANLPDAILDTRDIREVDAQDILTACKLSRGDLDLFEGSPPCAAFSLSGPRDKNWGDVRDYSGTRQRVDDLFYEWLRLVEGVQPKVCLAENVVGMAVGKAKGYLIDVVRGLEAAGYCVDARILDAQWLGVPQTRQRVFIQGVRGDLGLTPRWPYPCPYRVTLAEALAGVDPWSDPAEDGSNTQYHDSNNTMYRYWSLVKPGQKHPRFFSHYRTRWDRPCQAILASSGPTKGGAGMYHPDECRKFTIPELRRICGFPDDFILPGKHKHRVERLGRAVPPPMAYRIGLAVRSLLEDTKSCHRA